MTRTLNLVCLRNSQFVLQFRMVWTRKAALFGAAYCILAYRSSIYFRLKDFKSHYFIRTLTPLG
jgi:hypothetical protein